MRLLFVQGGPSVTFDNEGNMYVASNDDQTMWKRYSKYCDELRLLFKKDNEVCTRSEALAKYFPFNPDATIVAVPDVYGKRAILRRIFAGRESREIIAEEVRKADRIIVRTPSFPFSRAVLSMCRKYNKRYMIEVIDWAFGLCWYSNRHIHKVFAPFYEFCARREIARAPYAMYVTKNVLQKIYPTSGKSLGCSDVELPELDDSLRNSHDCGGGAIVFGTAGSICKLKGQEHVIRAIAKLKAQGITGIEYQMVGTISPQYQKHITNLITSLNVQDNVKFCGPIPHDRIFDWYDNIDVYISASFTEGLSRSVLEAMSRALPVMCSCAGGNPELASENMLFSAGNVNEICSVMRKLLDPQERHLASEYSFSKARDFTQSSISPIRDKFYMEFIHS